MAQKHKIIFDGKPATQVESKHSFGPRGEYFSYLIYVKNELVAIGEEEGNYAGGIYARKDSGGITTETIMELPTELQDYIKESGEQ